jgi:hypothetical protein
MHAFTVDETVRLDENENSIADFANIYYSVFKERKFDFAKYSYRISSYRFCP